MSDGLIVLIVIVVLLALAKAANTVSIVSQWHQRFETVPFSSQELYAEIKQALAKRGLNKLLTSHITFPQGGILSPQREYLTIAIRDYLYYVCAAPVGNGYFVSCRLGETGSLFRDFFVNLPVVGKLFQKREKTYYELDSEAMFKEIISACVKDSITALTQQKGFRNLSEAELKELSQLSQ